MPSARCTTPTAGPAVAGAEDQLGDVGLGRSRAVRVLAVGDRDGVVAHRPAQPHVQRGGGVGADLAVNQQPVR